MSKETERFQQLMEKVTDFAIIFTDVEGIIEEWNIGAERLFGYSRGEVIGRSAHLTFQPKDRTAGTPEREMLNATQIKPENFAEDDRWHIRKDGTLFYASGLLHALYHDGGLSGYVKIIRDLTEHLELKSALEAMEHSVEVKIEARTFDLDEANKILKLEMSAQKRNDVLRLRFIERIVGKQEDERKRIARDIHDHLGQEMTALSLQLQILKQQSAENAEYAERIEKIQNIASKIDSTIDFLARELRPAALEELGLRAALVNYANDWSKQFKIPANIESAGYLEKRLLPVAEVNLYRIAQEALNNVAKHADAKNVSVLLKENDDRLVLIIEDDGIGFDVEEVAESGGLGLIGMGERSAMLNGEVEIESAKNKGTTIYVRVPAVFAEEEAPIGS